MWVIPVPIKSATATKNPHNIKTTYFKKFHTQTNNNVYELNLIQDQINYLYAACFSPPKSTFLHAILQGFFVTFPNLTAKLVSKYLIKSIASAKDHLYQQHLYSKN